MKFLMLNGSLKTDSSTSNTRALCDLVGRKLSDQHDVEILDLSALKFEPGTGRTTQAGSADDMTQVLGKVLQADSIIFATPIWWGQASSLIQAVMERMTWFDDWYIENQINALYGKTLGLIVSGTDDGWQQIYGQCYSFASILGFTVPPETALGISEQDPEKIATDAEISQQADLVVRNLLAWTAALKAADIPTVQKKYQNKTGILANPSNEL
jgi:multimeric flavodoxin WrbA